MPNARDLARGRTRMLPLIVFALNEGWKVSRSADGCLSFTKAGQALIFTAPAGKAGCGDHPAKLVRRIATRNDGTARHA